MEELGHLDGLGVALREDDGDRAGSRLRIGDGWPDGDLEELEMLRVPGLGVGER